ncbi:nicotinamide mononucleotide transporter, partial [Escherichia coli]|uniref:nicotinamide mononucleotide transporter n=1 Tax=Escherichia coli TaxID=562 RepID=UPI0015E5AF0B
GRRIEHWSVWLAVNTRAVPLYMTRGLNLTAGLYFRFWINAWYGLYQWRKELQTS